MSSAAKRYLLPLLLVLGAGLFFVLQVGASGPAPSPKSAFTADLLMDLGRAGKEVMALENAVPQDKFTWRPGEGVRSVSEVFLHIANSNYLMLGATGVKTPVDMKSLMNEDESAKGTTDKAKIAAELKASFEWAAREIGNFSDADLDKKVDFFGSKATVRFVLLTLATHCHEHLGQAIAYARANQVVPPWTAAQQAKAKKGM